MPTTEIENMKNPSKIHPNPENIPAISNNTPKNFKALIIIINAYFGITFSFQWSLTLLDNINFAKLENFSTIFCTKPNASMRTNNSIVTTTKTANMRWLIKIFLLYGALTIS